MRKLLWLASLWLACGGGGSTADSGGAALSDLGGPDLSSSPHDLSASLSDLSASSSDLLSIDLLSSADLNGTSDLSEYCHSFQCNDGTPGAQVCDSSAIVGTSSLDAQTACGQCNASCSAEQVVCQDGNGTANGYLGGNQYVYVYSSSDPACAKPGDIIGTDSPPTLYGRWAPSPFDGRTPNVNMARACSGAFSFEDACQQYCSGSTSEINYTGETGGGIFWNHFSDVSASPSKICFTDGASTTVTDGNTACQLATGTGDCSETASCYCD